eukprot:14580-Eustigmatos_ZCMA.PRE.1
MTETPPLLVVEFLHRVADIFREYFGGVDDASIKDNFSTVYQVCARTTVFILWRIHRALV